MNLCVTNRTYTELHRAGTEFTDEISTGYIPEFRFRKKSIEMLSLVIPIFNEENLIDELVKRTIAAIESFTSDYEVIFVDDGSTDQSLKTDSKLSGRITER